MENNLTIYEKYSTPPAWALKEIQAGRLKGKTDINPQWRIKSLTEEFGLVGFGWKYTIDKTEVIEGANGEKSAFATVSLFLKKDGVWSDAIVGVGGSSFVAQEKNGLYVSDECFKMAITDALSVCCKLIGLGSDIYSGSKYDKKPTVEPQPKTIPEVKFMVEAQKTELIRIASLSHVWNEEEIKGILAFASNSKNTFDIAKEKIQAAHLKIKERVDILEAKAAGL